MSWCIGLSVELPSSMPVKGDGSPLLNMTVPTKEVTLWLGVNHNLLMHISIHIAIFNKHLQLNNGTRTYHGDSILLQMLFDHVWPRPLARRCKTLPSRRWWHWLHRFSALLAASWGPNLDLAKDKPTNHYQSVVLIITYNYHPLIINMWGGLWLRLSHDISST